MEQIVSDIFINYLLDRSGSMQAIWEQTISGLNEYKNEQAKQEGTTYFTLTTFDSPGYDKVFVETVVEAEDANKIKDLDPWGDVQPRGMTPLLDAIGIVIENTEDWLASHRDFGGKILIVINTDGHENSSKEFTKDGVKSKIKHLEEKDWQFVFMGAGIDAFAEAAQYGISAQNTMSYAATNQGSSVMTRNLSSSTTSYRSKDSNEFSWEEE